MSNIGKVLYGFCNGYFGRDSYEDKRIEAEGVDWIVARATEEDYLPEFCSFENEEKKQEYINEWGKEYKELI